MTARAPEGLDPFPTVAQIEARLRERLPRRPDVARFNPPMQQQEPGEKYSAPHSARPTAPRLSEHDHQVRLFQWRDAHLGAIPELRALIAIPNGGHRSKAVAGKLKAEGVRAGVHDLFWPLARGRYHGLWIELKTEGGRPTETQLEWRALMRANGYRAEIVTGWEAARDLILRYHAA